MEISEALAEGQVLRELDKSDQIAALAATMAEKEILAGVDIEGRPILPMQVLAREVAEEDVGIRQLAVKRGIREARVNQSDLSGGVHRKREHRTRCKVRGFRALATAQAIASDGEHNSARLRSPQLIRSCVWIVSTEALIDPYAERVRSLSSGVELKMQRTEVPRTLDPDPPAGQSNGVVAASKRAGEVVV